MAEGNKLRVVTVKLPLPLFNQMNDFVNADTHATNSEFIRAAIREHLKKLEGETS